MAESDKKHGENFEPLMELIDQQNDFHMLQLKGTFDRSAAWPANSPL